MEFEKVFKVSSLKEEVKAFIQEFFKGELHELTANQKFEIKLVLTEMMANAFVHGSQGVPAKNITVRYNWFHPIFWLEVEDEGAGYSEKEVKWCSSDETGDVVRESGRGLGIIRELAERVDVTESGRCILVKMNLEKNSSMEVECEQNSDSRR